MGMSITTNVSAMSAYRSLTQAGTAMLSQAIPAPQSILKLLAA